MFAIIRQGNGKYYISAVFGQYKNEKSKSSYNKYYVVFDEEKKHLIKWFAMQPNTKYLIKQVLIVDFDVSDWDIDEENNVGGVKFLPRDMADKMIESGVVPQDILEKCLKIDKSFVYSEYKEIENEKDIENLYCASGWFHDAYIKERKMLDDGTLYLLFDGIWGCSIEVWFWGDVEYDTESRNPEWNDPYWYGSTIILQDGFIYFVDEDDMTVDEIGKGYCWFKARHMKYHIIPD